MEKLTDRSPGTHGCSFLLHYRSVKVSQSAYCWQILSKQLDWVHWMQQIQFLFKVEKARAENFCLFYISLKAQLISIKISWLTYTRMLHSRASVAFGLELMSSDGAQLSLGVLTLYCDTLQLVTQQWWPNHCQPPPGFQHSSFHLYQTNKGSFCCFPNHAHSCILLIPWNSECSEHRTVDADWETCTETATVATFCLYKPGGRLDILGSAFHTLHNLQNHKLLRQLCPDDYVRLVWMIMFHLTKLMISQ